LGKTPAMSGQHRLIATFDEMERAREAILALERVGIEGSNVTLESADRDRPPVEATDTRGRDRQLGGDVGNRVSAPAARGSAPTLRFRRTTSLSASTIRTARLWTTPSTPSESTAPTSWSATTPRAGGSPRHPFVCGILSGVQSKRG